MNFEICLSAALMECDASYYGDGVVFHVATMKWGEKKI